MDAKDSNVGRIAQQIIETVTAEELIGLQAVDDSRFAGLNDSVCTYDEGYIRQELFSCLTCYEAKKEVAGVCYACSIECHGDHQLVELYTKRDFTCDCGNDKFQEKCKLQPDRNATNKYNKYSDNFLNKWCTCKKPFPPDENTPEYDAEMLQCAVCEDWFHNIHLDKMPEDDVEEIACKECVSRLQFLLAYENFPNEERSTDGCLMENRKEMMKQEAHSLSFASSNEFRDGLCKCSECQKLYSLNECEFLTNYGESAVKYNLNRDALDQTMVKKDVGTEILNIVQRNLGHDAAVMVKNDLDVLKAIAEDEFKKITTVVTKEDVKRIFDRAIEVRAKRRRLEDYSDVDV